ncbi:MAG: methyl-accepting chemotaxis protein [Cognaticolwellia sp.]
MLIKHKLLASSAIVGIAMLFMLGLSNYSVNAFKRDVHITKSIGAIDSLVLQLRRNEKDFIARKNLKYSSTFESNFKRLQVEVAKVSSAFDKIDKQVTELSQLSSVLNEYRDAFRQLVAAQQRIGLHPKDGLYGELRAAVHNVEAELEGADYKLLSDMLQLRRNEKDFMLRLDEKYFTRWQENAKKFSKNVELSTLTVQVKQQVLDNITLYEQGFSNLVRAQKQLGFNANSGIQGDMRGAVHQVDTMIESAMKVSQESVAEHTNTVNTIAYSVFAIVLVLASLAALALARNILSRLNHLNNVMKQVANTQNLSIRVEMDNNDEVGEMAAIFNQMLGSFRHLIVQVNQSVDTLNAATDNLSENIHTSNVGVDSQITQTDLVATAVTEMVATVEEISQNTHDAASKAESTNLNAKGGSSGVAETISMISELSKRLSESEGVVHALAKESDTIGSVLDVIRGIAEQTNLLALNAAIEAARAGEQGRGFAVVADEVRTLASRTQESTKEIETIISSLQSRTQDIVNHMAACRSQGKDSAAQASSAGAMLEKITDDVTAIMEMSTAIAAAIHQQSTVASEVNQHVVAIRDVTEQSGATAQHNAQMSEELSEQARVLREEVSLFTV